AAEDLFWLGRYAERAEAAVRLLRVLDDLAEDWTSRPGTPGHVSLRLLLEACTRITTTFPGFAGPDAAALLEDPRPELLSLVVDAGRPGTLAHAVNRTVEAAHAVRDQLSLDTWFVLGSLERVLDEVRQAAVDETDQPLQPALARVLEGLLALAGLGAESMVRDVGWYFMDAGRRVERALQVAALLQHLVAPPGAPEYPTAVQALVLESVLIAGESIITYRRRHQGRPEPAGVAELLLADRHNPRSIAYQLDRLAEDLPHLPPEPARDDAGARERLAAVQARLREAAGTGSLAAPGDVVAALHAELTELAAGLARAHFVPVAPQRSLAGTPRWLP
ncbi:MAG TPA: alpha-E domain-containing protein, partial [Kineosporiaceae bacterium]